MLQAIGILAIAAVSRPAAGLDISHAPRLRPQRPQKGGWIHGASTLFHIIWLLNDAALFPPKFIEGQNHVLKIHCYTLLNSNGKQKSPHPCPQTGTRAYSRGSTLIDKAMLYPPQDL